MSRAAYLESVAGVAGDMFAAACVDAGVVGADALRQVPAMLGLAGVSVDITQVTRASLSATHIAVSLPQATKTPRPRPRTRMRGGRREVHLNLGLAAYAGGHARYTEVDRLLAQSRLDAAVKARARGIFRVLAQAEARVHGHGLEEVAFHEVGSIDSLVDVAMASLCIEHLGPCRFYASPVRPGRGSVSIAHGSLPIPPPATLLLMEGMRTGPTPPGILRPNVELSTPTGIAILKTLSPVFVDELPAGEVVAHGCGAGTMDLGVVPNVFRLVVLDEKEAGADLSAYDRDRVVEISCNVDDDSGEHLGWMVAQLMERGALDAWLTPTMSKKGRPAYCLSALATTGSWQGLADWVLRNGTTFGMRYRTWDRLKLVPRVAEKLTRAGKVKVKTGMTRDGRVIKRKAEFDSLPDHAKRSRI
jgi:pyridinium-3,5-bisthiocarboxylic acid mononucleotide nickel chelatase